MEGIPSTTSLIRIPQRTKVISYICYIKMIMRNGLFSENMVQFKPLKWMSILRKKIDFIKTVLNTFEKQVNNENNFKRMFLMILTATFNIKRIMEIFIFKRSCLRILSKIIIMISYFNYQN